MLKTITINPTTSPAVMPVITSRLLIAEILFFMHILLAEDWGNCI
jgi:hypothetical protein